MTRFPYKQNSVNAVTLPKTIFKKSKPNLLRFFYRFDYLPPMLPPYLLGRQTIWEQLEQTASREIISETCLK